MEKSELQICFEKIEGIDFRHKEGGRYAYVQMMAFVRELRELLEQYGFHAKEYFPELDHTSELLNELVALRFEEGHRLVFEDRMRLLSELKVKLVVAELLPDFSSNGIKENDLRLTAA